MSILKHLLGKIFVLQNFRNSFVSVINSTCGVSLTSIIDGNTPLSNLLKHVLTSTFLLVGRNCVELPEEK